MKNWFNQLASRERRVLIIGIIALAGILFYFMLWEPLIIARAQLEKIVIAQQATLDWMNEAATEIQQLRHNSQAISSPNRSQSLLNLIDKSIRTGALSKTNKRIEAKGKQEVRLHFENVSFTELMRWLGQLYNQYQIQINSINIERQSVPDKVKVRLTLKLKMSL
jgi:general secretion pathway protein M